MSQPQGCYKLKTLKLRTPAQRVAKMALVEIIPESLDLMFQRTLKLLTMVSNLKLMERKVIRLLVLKKQSSTHHQARTTSLREAK